MPPEKVAVVGLGYVGAVSLACLARDGHQMTGVDIDLRALAHGHRIAVLTLAEALPPGVDTPADLEQVRAIIAQQR